jgi:hypothetical protein
MTFEQWQQTRKHVKCLETALPKVLCDTYKNQPGIVYGDGCWIEVRRAFILSTETCLDLYYLILDRDDYLSTDLLSLERKLYDWGH